MGSRPQASSSALLQILVLLLPLCADASSSKAIYVVYMGEKKHDDPSVVTASHHAALTSILGSKDAALESIVYSYKYGFSGFAAKLSELQAEELKKYPGVLSVKPNTYHKLHTTRSWDFLGLSYDQPSSPSGGLLKKAKYGEDVIVGVIDSGIWPESRSFEDTGYGPVPKRWKGVCQIGEAFNATSCNRKIIGARWYLGDASADDLKGEYKSARDLNGHGTHTASTVAGGLVRGAGRGGVGGLGAGAARGGAPRARLAVYKACRGLRGSCGQASLLAAVDDAINDGVDVLSMSLGFGLFDTPGTLHAVARGVAVVYSAGNDGPVQQSVENDVPWVLTVAATTIDRSFPTVITLDNGKMLVGQSLYYHKHAAGSSSSHDLIPLHFDLGCTEDNLGSANITGKIVVCLALPFPNTYQPGVEFSIAMNAAIKGGAKGLIFQQYATDALDYLEGCEGHMPCVVVDRETIYRIDSTAAKISPATTMVGSQVPAPRVATFSGRGPSAKFPGLLKPDIAAPGVSILAAKGNSYELMSGTSMACPHVSAIVALLKSVHPDWSPAMIKSAIVTTASVTDRFGLPIQADSVQRKPADPFDFGGGHIDPDKALDPGLVYDINPKEYTKFFNCTLGPKDDCSDATEDLYQLNLPSIAVHNLKESVTVWRTVTIVGPTQSATYKAKVEAPAGVRMAVEPSVITFGKRGPRSMTFKVTFMAKQRVQGGYTFGSLTWLDFSKHSVRIPIAVRTIVRDFVADAS